MRRVVQVAVASICLGCGGNEPSEANEPLAVAEDFEPLSEQDDPLAAHRPAEVMCSTLTGWFLEDDVLEVDTASCNYLAVSAPARLDVEAGRTLVSEVAYFDLTAPEPAVAHVALLVGERLVWEREIPVPGPADVIAVTADLPEAVPAGTPVIWHLHNHGRNNWRLADVLLAR